MKAKSIFKQYCSENAKKIVGLVLTALISILSLVAIPVLIKFIIDNFQEIAIAKANPSDKELLNEAMIKGIIFTSLLGLSTILSFIFNFIFNKKLVKFGSDVTNVLRKSAFNALMRGELYEISDVSIDDLKTNVLDSTSRIGNDYYANHFIKVLYNFALFVCALITILCFDTIFGLIVLGISPIYYFIYKFMGKVISKKQKFYNKLNDEQVEYIKYNISNIKNIKVRNAIDKEENKYNELLEKTKKSFDSNCVFSSMSSTVLTSFVLNLVMCSFMAIFLWQLSINDNFELSNLTACLVLCPIVFNAFKSFADTYMDKHNVNETFNSLNEILEIKLETRSETITSLEEVHSLSFNNVSFDYANGAHKGIERVNFEIKKGEKIGILGFQKSGKTTVADLICKIIRPKYGNVLINNCDINKISTNYLREIITYIPQDFTLCEGTLENNIIYPLELDEYKYNDSLNKCKLKTLLMNLPKRDQEDVKDIKLSAADIQRIGLAHALYKDSEIIVLDEATNKLDPQGENEILNEVYKLKNKITVVISNRISTLLKCDKILILNDGKVVEYGKTEDLMKDSRSTYSKMVGDVNKKIV